ncbi:MAG: 6-bladed beta-propeller [Candidatus Aminicenantales bacterium]
MMSQRLSACTVVLTGIAAVTFAGSSLQAQEIEIKMEDGIPVVYNPKEPVPQAGQPSKFTLKEDFTIGKDTEDPNCMFSGLQHTQVDEEEYMIAADWKECLIKVYDRNGKHVRSFGRKGQGPGEIGLPYYLGIFQGNKIVVHDQMNGKFIIYSREGELLKEVPMGIYRTITRFKVDSEGNFYAFPRTFDETKVSFELKKFDPALEPLATFATYEVTRNPRVVRAFQPAQQLFVQISRDENIIWLEPLKYELTLMNREGKAVRKIVKDYEPVKITEAHEKRLIQQTWGDQGIRPGYKFDIPKHFPPVRAFYVDDDERIYVRTYDYVEKEGQQLDRYDVFDPEGRYIAKFYHPRAETAQAFRKNKMYVRVEEEAYGMDLLRRYSLIWE